MNPNKKHFRLHVDDRHGVEWPREPGAHFKWCGWLTHREYDIIEMRERFEIDNFYKVGDRLGVKYTTAERIYHNMIDSGIVLGKIYNYSISPMAKILWDMTDQYILQLPFEEEDAA